MNVQLRHILTVKSKHDKPENITLSPDGLLFALWAVDGHLSLIMSHTGEHLVKVKTEDDLEAVLWSPSVDNMAYCVICGFASGMIGIIEYSVAKVRM